MADSASGRRKHRLTRGAELFLAGRQTKGTIALCIHNPSASLLFSSFSVRITLYVRMKIMKLVSHTLSSRPFALARLVQPRSLATNTRHSLISTIPFTPNRTQHRQYTSLPAPVTDMSAPPKRKWTRGGRGGGRGGGGGGGGDRTNGTPGRGPANARSAMSQQPKRPRVEDTLPKPDAGVDVRQMYSTAAGDAAPKPFADLKNKLHPALLNGLDKMGFE